MRFDSFSRYGIKLKRLSKDELEMLRSWRNLPRIAKEMKKQNGKEITFDEQKLWFESIKDRDDAFYYISYLNEEAIGYNAIKNINWIDGCGEAGGFSKIDPDIIDPRLRAFVFFSSHDLYFEIMKLNFTRIEVKNTNKKAIRLNKFFGYEREEKLDGGDFLGFILTKDRYIKRRDELLKLL